MKRLFLFSALFFFVFLTGCKIQEDPVKLLAEQEEMESLFQNAVQAIKDKNFVLEANYLVFKRGHTAYVNSSTNFISLEGNKATIQLASSYGIAGPNGIGGITVEGNISNLKVQEDKNGNISFSMNVSGVGVSANVFFNMYKGTNQCSATVTPNFYSGRITFTGNLYPRDYSNIFIGRPL